MTRPRAKRPPIGEQHEPLLCKMTDLPISVCEHCLIRCCLFCKGSLTPHACRLCKWHEEA